QAVGLNILAHLVDGFQCREQLFTLWCVHAIETAVHGWRAGDAHMDLGSPGFPHHLHDFQAGRPAHDTVINQDNFLAIHKWSVGIMLKLHTKMSNTVAWLDKCSAEIVGTDNPELIGNALLCGITNRSGSASIKHRDDVISVYWILDSKLRADCLTHAIN